jgi:fluoride exporter
VCNSCRSGFSPTFWKVWLKPDLRSVVNLSAYLWIALGGALGSVARFICTEWVQARWSGFPWGTLAVNVLGSVVIGALAALNDSEHGAMSLLTRQFLLAGVLGGFTTFSSFSLQTLVLMRSGEVLLAGLNVLASVGLCLAAAWLGYSAISRM